jgi:protein SERAC1
MWLRDALPYDITGDGTDKPLARVLVYGYDSTLWHSQSVQNLDDFGTSFHASLLELTTSATLRPIVFVAHSLGGLIVKQVGPHMAPIMQYSHRATDLNITFQVQKGGRP